MNLMLLIFTSNLMLYVFTGNISNTITLMNTMLIMLLMLLVLLLLLDSTLLDLQKARQHVVNVVKVAGQMCYLGPPAVLKNQVWNKSTSRGK